MRITKFIFKFQRFMWDKALQYLFLLLRGGCILIWCPYFILLSYFLFSDAFLPKKFSSLFYVYLRMGGGLHCLSVYVCFLSMYLFTSWKICIVRFVGVLMLYLFMYMRFRTPQNPFMYALVSQAWEINLLLTNRVSVFLF